MSKTLVADIMRLNGGEGSLTLKTQGTLLKVVELSLSEISKRRSATLLIMSIFSTQFVIGAVIYNLHLVVPNHLAWQTFYYIVSFFAAIPQAGFSDDSGRKKHLLIAIFATIFSVIYLLVTVLLKPTNGNPSSLMSWTAGLPVCSALGFLGNAIPIARGSLIHLGIHDFRTSIGLTSAFIGLGWISAAMLELIFGFVATVTVAIALQSMVWILIKWRYIDHSKKAFDKSSCRIIIDSYKWFFTMLTVAGGTAALIAYVLPETSFYNIYSVSELDTAGLQDRIIGIAIGLAYLLGTILQSIIYPSNRWAIKLGLGISSAALLGLCLNGIALQYYGHKVPAMVSGGFQCCFSLGFGFFVPALFALMAVKIHADHSSRLFGVIDSTDTAALGLSSAILFAKERLHINNQFLYTISLALLGASFFAYKKFLKIFTSYEDS